MLTRIYPKQAGLRESLVACKKCVRLFEGAAAEPPAGARCRATAIRAGVRKITSIACDFSIALAESANVLGQSNTRFAGTIMARIGAVPPIEPAVPSSAHVERNWSGGSRLVLVEG